MSDLVSLLKLEQGRQFRQERIVWRWLASANLAGPGQAVLLK